MESIAKLHYTQKPLHLSLTPHLSSSFPKPLPSSLSFKTPLSLSPTFPKLPSIRAASSSSSSSSSSLHQNPNRSPSNPIPFSLIKTTLLTLSATAALFLTRLHLKPATAAPPVTTTPPPAPLVENQPQDQETTTAATGEEDSSQYPEDIDALRSLMESKIKSRELPEAIRIIERLIEIEPEETEWPLMKANLHSYSGDFELAKTCYEGILEKDPLRVEAYHGLVMAASETGSELDGVMSRIKSAMERCKKEKRNSDLRDFKLLIAQVRVIEGKYNEALKVYQELVKEEPRDFRPYLCQGIIYTLLRKKDEAEKQFKQYRRLVPKNHPYAEYFDDNMFATMLFSQKVERE